MPPAHDRGSADRYANELVERRAERTARLSANTIDLPDGSFRQILG